MSQKNQKKKRNDTKDADSETSILDDMPLAKAVLNNDAATVGSTLARSLPNPESVVVEDVEISKSAGEAFTGGKSTPVYHVSCEVSRKNGKQRRQRHFIAKLVLMPEQSDGSSSWQKRESYAVERRFYDSTAAHVRSSSLAIPRFLYSDHDGSRPWPAVCFLMNDVRHAGYPVHPEFLSPFQAKQALRWIATFHALFWGQQSSGNWKRDLWSRGGFWTPKEDQNGNNATRIQTMGVAQQWAQTVRWLESKHPAAITSHTRELGKRLEAAAGPISEFLVTQSQTLIHGDFKAANLFLAEAQEEEEDPGADSVAVLDFQFTGTGLGAEDVAYLLFPDARGHYFDDEAELLECYHEELINQLILQRRGGPSSLPLESFRAYYELSRIDQLRYLLRKGWVASNQGDVKLVAALEDTLNQLGGGQALSSDSSSSVQALSSFVGLK